MSYGILKYGLPAERQRGLIFAEKFESYADIQRNGGTITGTKVEYPAVNNSKTVLAKLKKQDVASQTVKINAGQTITIAIGDVFGYYTNAVAFDADDLAVDDFSKFESVRIFKNELTAVEITDYESNSIFNYGKDAVLNLPMGIAQHDAVNGITYDVSGHNNHAQFGDGSTAGTFPTKISERRGYSFDGSDYLQVNNPVIDMNADFSLSCVVKLDDLTGYMGIMARRDAGDDGVYIFYVFGSNEFRVQYNSVGVDSGVLDGMHGGYISVTVTFDVSGSMVLYVNGIEVDSADISAEIVAVTSQIFFLGSLPIADVPSAFLIGDVLSANIYDSCLTPLQVADLHLRSIKSFNRVIPNIVTKPLMLSVDAIADTELNTDFIISGITKNLDGKILIVEASNDGGVTWVTLGTVTPAGDTFSDTFQVSSDDFAVSDDIIIRVRYESYVGGVNSTTVVSGDYIIDDFESYINNQDLIAGGQWLTNNTTNLIVTNATKVSGVLSAGGNGPFGDIRWNKYFTSGNYNGKKLQIYLKWTNAYATNIVIPTLRLGLVAKQIMANAIVSTNIWTKVEFNITFDGVIDNIYMQLTNKWGGNVYIDDVKII